MADYGNSIYWISASIKKDGGKHNAVAIPVDDRAATRHALINALARKGYELIERSAWHAKSPRGAMRESHWDYHDIVLHHAGRSYSCGAPSIEEIHRVQAEDMGRSRSFDDVGYHYAVSFQCEIYEARDIRFIGEHVAGSNSGKIGIVFLSDLVEVGEAYEQEYRDLYFFDKLKNFRSILTDRAISGHDKPTPMQIRAAEVLCGVLKTFLAYPAWEGIGNTKSWQQIRGELARAILGWRL